MKTEEASDTGGEEPQEEDPPPQINNLNEYQNIFRTRREREFVVPVLFLFCFKSVFASC